MEAEETAILRLRADGLSYRQIARRLGIPLTRAYKLAQQAIAPEPELTSFAGAEDETPLPVAPPPPKPDAIAEPGQGGTGFLTGPFAMPTRADLERGYTMPGPNGTVIVIGGRGG